MATITLNITGMHCKSCSALLQDALEEEGASVSFQGSKATVETSLPKEKVIAIIKKEGYGVQ